MRTMHFRQLFKINLLVAADAKDSVEVKIFTIFGQDNLFKHTCVLKDMNLRWPFYIVSARSIPLLIKQFW